MTDELASPAPDGLAPVAHPAYDLHVWEYILWNWAEEERRKREREDALDRAEDGIYG